MHEELGSPLPHWAEAIVHAGQRLDDERAALDATIRLAVASARQGGGPFGALVADEDLTVVSVGWNRVVEDVDSTAHAEIEAIRCAQLRLETHDLGAPGVGPLTLFSSCAPCVMCFGAVYWSGLARVVAAARADEAEALGFLEGPVTDAMWEQARKDKGITYEPEAPTHEDPGGPFRVYRDRGGEIY